MRRLACLPTGQQCAAVTAPPPSIRRGQRLVPPPVVHASCAGRTAARACWLRAINAGVVACTRMYSMEQCSHDQASNVRRLPPALGGWGGKRGDGRVKSAPASCLNTAELQSPTASAQPSPAADHDKRQGPAGCARRAATTLCKGCARIGYWPPARHRRSAGVLERLQADMACGRGAGGRTGGCGE